LQHALKSPNHHQGHTSRLRGISRKTLRDKIARLSISRD
jgi:DNA-binding NtrC family response regulator